jgi:hypothetical protein
MAKPQSRLAHCQQWIEPRHNYHEDPSSIPSMSTCCRTLLRTLFHLRRTPLRRVCLVINNLFLLPHGVSHFKAIPNHIVSEPGPCQICIISSEQVRKHDSSAISISLLYWSDCRWANNLMFLLPNFSHDFPSYRSCRRYM